MTHHEGITTSSGSAQAPKFRSWVAEKQAERAKILKSERALDETRPGKGKGKNKDKDKDQNQVWKKKKKIKKKEKEDD